MGPIQSIASFRSMILWYKCGSFFAALMISSKVATSFVILAFTSLPAVEQNSYVI